VEVTAIAMPFNDGSADDLGYGSSTGSSSGGADGGARENGGHSLLDALAPFLEPEMPRGGGGQGSPRGVVAPVSGGDGYDDYGPPPENRPRQPLAINGHVFTPTDDGTALRTEDGHLLQLDGDVVELPSAGRRGSGSASSGGSSSHLGGDYYDDLAGEEGEGPKMKVQLKSGPGGADVLVVDGASMTLGEMRPTGTSGTRTGTDGKTGGTKGGDGAHASGASAPGGRGAAAMPGGEDEPPVGSSGGSQTGGVPKGQGGAQTASVFKDAAGRVEVGSWTTCVVGLAVLLAVL